MRESRCESAWKIALIFRSLRLMIDNYRPSLLKLRYRRTNQRLVMNYSPNKHHFRSASSQDCRNDDELLSLYSQLRRMNTTTPHEVTSNMFSLIILFVWFPNCTFRCWFAFTSADCTGFWLSRSANVPVSTCFSASDSHLTAIIIRSSAIKIELKAQLSLLSIGTRSGLIKMPAVASRIGDSPFANPAKSRE